MQEIIRRLENAKGPDRRLADQVMLAFGWRTNHELTQIRVGQTYAEIADGACWYPPDKSRGWIHGHVRPDPTASLDDALELAAAVIPGCYWAVGAGRARATEPLYGALINLKDENGVAHPEPLARAEHEASAPLAVLLALARACQSQGGADAAG